MTERLTDANASNWVDRDEDPAVVMQRVLEFYLGEGGAAIAAPRWPDHVAAVRGMVEADSSEYQVAGYLVLMEREAAMEDPDPGRRRTVAIALWHIAKCAEVRDRARRLMAHGSRPGPPAERAGPAET